MEYFYFNMDWTSGKETFVSDDRWDKVDDDNTVLISGVSLLSFGTPTIEAIKYGAGRKNDYLIGAKYSIVSDRLKEFLQALESDTPFLEFIPVEIKPEKMKSYTYWVLNILENISCFDWNKSKYGEARVANNGKTYPLDIEYLALDAEKIGLRNIFRVEEKMAKIVVSQWLRDQVVEKGFTGIEFEPLPGHETDSI